jgi:hypothetical protein
MTPFLCSLVLLTSDLNWSAYVARVRLQFHAAESGKAYLGLTEKELIGALGQPTSRRPGVWEYWDRLGPGFNSHQRVRVVRFARGRVTSAAVEWRPVGCIIVEPRYKK